MGSALFTAGVVTKSFATLWRWLRKPGTRYALGLLVLGGLGGIVFWGGFHTVLEYTNRLEFCTSCHEMGTVYAEYKESIHYRNPVGVRAICSDCHVPHEWGPKMLRKIQASGELWGKLTGTISTPEKFEARRLELAQQVWATIVATNSRECRNCHSFEAMDFHKQPQAAQEQMQKAMASKQTCIECHKGIAHKLPDLTKGYKQSLIALKELSAKEGAKAQILYTLETKSLFAERASAKPDAGGDGKLLGGSRVEVLERDGDWLKVRVDGWQQEGAERALYELMGKRILTAALSQPALEKVERKETVRDSETDITWFRASLTAWISKDGLIADRQKLWAYGEEMYSASCGTCHALPPVDHYLANQWIGSMNAMKRFLVLDDEQYRFLLKYAQMHAEDTKNAEAGKPGGAGG